jgi:hypothetical protein
VDLKPTGITYPMDKNDEAGDCVVAGTHHALQVIFNLLGLGDLGWTLDQILVMYQSQNPDMNSWADSGSDADQGMIIAKFLSWMVANGEEFGLTDDRKLLGYAKVDHNNHEEMRSAIYLFLVIVTGADLQVADQSGKDWSYVQGSGEWGGHCMASPSYNDKQMGTITWGEDDYILEDSFITNCMDEAYVLLTQAHVNHPEFRNHFDLYSFAQAWQAITHKTFPIHVDPPTPAPNPNPTPTPGGGASFQVGAQVAARIIHAAARQEMTPDEYVEWHFEHYFSIHNVGQDQMEF